MTPEQENNIRQQIETFRAQVPGVPPSPIWFTVTNTYGPGTAVIALPQSGILWVAYSYTDVPAKMCVLLNTTGGYTAITPGLNRLFVNAWDAILYQLADPVNDQIQIGYQYIQQGEEAVV